MKKIKPYKRLAVFVTCSALNILFSSIIALVIALVLIFCANLIEWIGILVFFVLWITLCIIDYFIFRKLIAVENKKRAKFLILETKIENINQLVQTHSPQKVDDSIYVFVYREFMLNTISLYEITDKSQIKNMRKQVQTFLKLNYKEAREDNARKRHHELKVQLYAVQSNDENIPFNQQFDQLLSIGFLECKWVQDKKKIIIPMYSGKDMEISSLHNYNKAINKLIEIFNVYNIRESDG